MAIPKVVRPAYRYAATVIRVIDGDTYVLDVDAGFNQHAWLTIRLLGWSCPEMRESNGPAARNEAELLLRSARQIIVETEKDDQTFARWLARIYVDGVELGESLAEQGLAVKGLGARP